MYLEHERVCTFNSEPALMSVSESMNDTFVESFVSFGHCCQSPVALSSPPDRKTHREKETDCHFMLRSRFKEYVNEGKFDVNNKLRNVYLITRSFLQKVALRLEVTSLVVLFMCKQRSITSSPSNTGSVGLSKTLFTTAQRETVFTQFYRVRTRVGPVNDRAFELVY